MIFKIKKGSHYSNKWWLPLFTFSNSIKGSFKFHSDCSYEIEKQEDSNKLIGLSDSCHHHKNSIRLGFRWDVTQEKIEITIIAYRNGERTIIPLCFVEQDEFNTFKISVDKWSYNVKVNDRNFRMLRSSEWFLPRIILKPYFGGTTKAPKEFKIEVKF